jgi:uncharacterized SAM-binding protein YcdF (DUF218 family)
MVAVTVAATVAVRGLGAWLVVSDPLLRARAIAVLVGDYPFRALEAAALYREGWAPEVWLPHAVNPAREAALARLGVEPAAGEHVLDAALLRRLGVPGRAVRVLEGQVRNTAEELRLIALETARADGKWVIVVTSKAHTRRVRATWRALVGRTPGAVVRYPSADPFEPAGWWRRSGDALQVSREAFGLVNVWAGFPVGPEDD